MSKNQKTKRKVRYDRIFIALSLIVIIVIALIMGINHHSEKRSSTGKNDVNLSFESTEVQSESETEPSPAKIHIIATGDNLVQTYVYRTAQAHAENGEEYNFGYIYDNVKDLITSGDLNIMNQETPICNDEFEISGSNFNFNSPTALGDQLIQMGVNTFSVCNNHILDKGTDGLKAQLDYWDKKRQENPDLMVYGVYRNEDDMNHIRIKEVNGVKVAFLAYTENTNGLNLDSNSEIKFTYTSETDVMKSQIEAAKKQADVVVVSTHWGDEDSHVVRDGVKELAQNLVDWGADVIIGTHPHTAQTMEYITRNDGTKGFVFYSLGNFVSAQTDNFNLVGEVADFNIVYDPSKKQASVEDIKVVPVITQYDDANLSNIRVYPYYNYTDELISQHGIPYTTSGTYRTWSREVIDNIINENIPKEYQCLTDPSGNSAANPSEESTEYESTNLQ